MQDIKKKVEALLFTTGSYMNTDEIARLCSIGSVGIVKEAIQELQKEYQEKDSAITIFKENDMFKLGIKKEFNYLTSQLLSDCELDHPTLKTLAIIAYKQPIIQAQVIKARGNGAYDHMKILKDHGFITAEKYGRTRLLKLAPKFFDYFDLVEDQLRSKFEGVSEELTQEEIKSVLGNLPIPKTFEKTPEEPSEDKTSEEDLEEE